MDNFAFYTDKEKKLKELRSNEEKIELKPGTEIISPFAFRTPNAKEIILPDSVEIVQRYAFENCQKLQKVVFGKGIKRIFPDIFRGCYNLSEIEFAGDKAPDFKFENGDMHGRVPLLLGLTQFIMCLNVRPKPVPFGNSDYNFQLYDSLMEKFLTTKIPQMTIKITVGEKSLRIPAYIPKYKDYVLDDLLRDWLKEIYSSAFYNRLLLLTSLVDDFDANYAMALELCFIDGDVNALRYLKEQTYPEIIHILRYEEYKTFREILQCDFLTDDELRALIQCFSENQMIEAMAYLMEYMKKNKNTDFSL